LNKNKKNKEFSCGGSTKHAVRVSHRLQLETKPIHGSQYYKLRISHPSVHHQLIFSVAVADAALASIHTRSNLICSWQQKKEKVKNDKN